MFLVTFRFELQQVSSFDDSMTGREKCFHLSWRPQTNGIFMLRLRWQVMYFYFFRWGDFYSPIYFHVSWWRQKEGRRMGIMGEKQRLSLRLKCWKKCLPSLPPSSSFSTQKRLYLLMKAIRVLLENRRQVSLKERSVYNHPTIDKGDWLLDSRCILVLSCRNPLYPLPFSHPLIVWTWRGHIALWHTHTHNKRGAQRRAWVWGAQSRSRPEPPPFSPPIRQNLGGVVGDEPLTPPHKVWRENRAEGFVCDRRPTRNARTLGEWNGRRPLEVVSLTHSHTHAYRF